jgi:hypothetical protein
MLGFDDIIREKSLPQSPNSRAHTAKTQYRTKNCIQIYPEKELLGLSTNFHIHVPVSDLNIPVLGLSFLLKENMWTDPRNI